MSINLVTKIAILMSTVFIASCGQRVGLAPVEEIKWKASNLNAKKHVVLKGETLYAIAFRYDRDYRQLAAANHLYNPYHLRIGQVIVLNNAAKHHYVNPSHRSIKAHVNPSILKPSYLRMNSSKRSRGVFNGQWYWPATGRVVSTFIPTQGKKGINIAGKKGEKIRASAEGIVAYAGNGLAGYGNLIIIKHANQVLTAYGNNLHNLVREGQLIKRGQVIADMGIIDRHYWGVHFEIRKAGEPVNPLIYLQKG